MSESSPSASPFSSSSPSSSSSSLSSTSPSSSLSEFAEFADFPNILAISERSEEHTSELQSLMRISYAVFCLKKKIENTTPQQNKLFRTTKSNEQNHTHKQ